jgi:integrase
MRLTKVNPFYTGDVPGPDPAMLPRPRRVLRELACRGSPEVCLVSQDPRDFRLRFWLPAIEAAGLDDVRVHDLRHTAVSLWIAAGANPKEVARRAGHTSVRTVFDVYGHLLPDADDALVDALGREVSTGGTGISRVYELPKQTGSQS